MTRFDLIAGDTRAKELLERLIELLHILPLERSSYKITIERIGGDDHTTNG